MHDVITRASHNVLNLFTFPISAINLQFTKQPVNLIILSHITIIAPYDLPMHVNLTIIWPVHHTTFTTTNTCINGSSYLQFIKTNKIISVLISVQVKAIQRQEVCDKSKSGWGLEHFEWPSHTRNIVFMEIQNYNCL